MVPMVVLLTRVLLGVYLPTVIWQTPDASYQEIMIQNENSTVWCMTTTPDRASVRGTNWRCFSQGDLVESATSQALIEFALWRVQGHVTMELTDDRRVIHFGTQATCVFPTSFTTYPRMDFGTCRAGG